MLAAALLLLSIGGASATDFVKDPCPGYVTVSYWGWGKSPRLLEKGYCDHMGYWIPGYISNDFYWNQRVDHFVTRALWQSEGQIELTAAQKGIDIQTAGFADGVAVPWYIPAREFASVWLKRPESDWEQMPFLALDCPRQEHQYHHVMIMDSGIELGYRTAEAWGLIEAAMNGQGYGLYGVEVCIGNLNKCAEEPVDLGSWYEQNARFKVGSGIYSFIEIWDIHPDPNS